MATRSCLVVFGFVASTGACAAGPSGFDPAPRAAAEPGPAIEVLEIRPVQYRGGTNGTLIVDVVNPSSVAREFSPEGLYFIPDNDGVQRVGAAGPMLTSEAQYRDWIGVNAGETARVGLSVFCIDQSRGSPGPETRFTTARRRLPTDLARAITTGARRIIRDNGGDIGRARQEIQTYVWAMREAGRLRLEGE